MKCYVASQQRDFELPSELNKDNTLFFPESSMTTHQQLNTGKPAEFHIVTDSPFLVPLYSREDVYVFEDGEWIHPNFQTYGCSYNVVLSELWESDCSIPRAVYDGITTNVMGHKIKQPDE